MHLIDFSILSLIYLCCLFYHVAVTVRRSPKREREINLFVNSHAAHIGYSKNIIPSNWQQQKRLQQYKKWHAKSSVEWHNEKKKQNVLTVKIRRPIFFYSVFAFSCCFRNSVSFALYSSESDRKMNTWIRVNFAAVLWCGWCIRILCLTRSRICQKDIVASVPGENTDPKAAECARLRIREGDRSRAHNKRTRKHSQTI